MRVFGQKKKKRPLPASKSPMAPTQEMLDIGLAAAMRSNNIRVVETKTKPEIFKEASVKLFEEATELLQPENPLQNTPIDEFITNFRESASEFLCTAYLMQRPVERSHVSGTLSTSLPEDVFALVEAQIGLLQDYLTTNALVRTDVGDSLLIEALLSILRNLRFKQTQFRNTFITELPCCVAAANDFSRMGELVECLQQSMEERYSHLRWTDEEESNLAFTFRKEASGLIDMFEADAVCAAHRIASFIIQGLGTPDLFSHDWEDKFVQNEIAISIIRTFEDYMSDIQNCIEHEYLFHKIVAGLVRSTVCLYVQCLVQKADSRRREMKRLKRSACDHAFLSASRAICRMNYDVEVLRDYFANLAKGTVALERIVENEFSVLVLLLECMWLAVGKTDSDSLEEFVVVVHKRTGANSDVTRQFLSDLWVLLGPKDEHRSVENTVRMMDAELQIVSNSMKERRLAAPAGNDLACLRLDETLMSLYQDRIFQEQSALCGNIIRDVRELHRENKRSLGEAKGRTMKRLSQLKPLKKLLGNETTLAEF